MSLCTITCPHCGFSKDIDRDPAILQGKTVTCPQCKKSFPFTSSESAAPELQARPEQTILTSAHDPIKEPESVSAPQHKVCPTCGSQIHIKAEICPKCGVRVAPPRTMVNKVALLVITFFLGGLGGHKFYLKKNLQGVLYLLFFWTYIPTLVAFVEFILYACKSEPELQDIYPETSTGGIFIVLLVPVLLAIVGILAAIAIPQYVAYRQRAGNVAANTALSTCQERVLGYYAENGMWPTDASQLQCQATEGVYLYYLANDPDDYQLISYSEHGNKAFVINEDDVEVVEVDKAEIRAELTNEIGAESLAPGFYFVK
nr:NINE protein [uncultured Desulfuromonas sp.]